MKGDDIGGIEGDVMELHALAKHLDSGADATGFGVNRTIRDVNGNPTRRSSPNGEAEVDIVEPAPGVGALNERWYEVKSRPPNGMRTKFSNDFANGKQTYHNLIHSFLTNHEGFAFLFSTRKLNGASASFDQYASYLLETFEKMPATRRQEFMTQIGRTFTKADEANVWKQVVDELKANVGQIVKPLD